MRLYRDAISQCDAKQRHWFVEQYNSISAFAGAVETCHQLWPVYMRAKHMRNETQDAYTRCSTKHSQNFSIANDIYITGALYSRFTIFYVISSHTTEWKLGWWDETHSDRSVLKCETRGGRRHNGNNEFA